MAVVFKADSDFSKVLKDYERLQSHVVKLESKLKGVTRESQNQGSIFKTAFSMGVGQITSMVAGYASLQGAISLVNESLERQKRISEDIKNVHLTVGESQSELIKQLGDMSSEKKAAFVEQVEAVAGRASFPVEKANLAAAGIVSAGVDDQLALSVLEEAIPFFRAKPDELIDFGGAVGDLIKETGDLSAEGVKKAMGMILTAQKFSRGQSLSTTKELLQGVAASMKVDSQADRNKAAQESLALVTALSQAIPDADVAMTRTAWAEVATELERALPETDLTDSKGNLIAKGTGLKSPLERMKRVQEDAQKGGVLWKQIMEHGSWRGAIAPVVKSWLTDPNSSATRAAKDSLAGITADTALVDRMGWELQNLTPQMRLLTIDAKSKSLLQRHKLEAESQAAHAQKLAILDPTLDQTDTGPPVIGFLESKSMSGLGLAGVSPELLLQYRKQSQFTMLPPWVTSLMPGGPGTSIAKFANTFGALPDVKERVENARLLQEQINLLREIAENVKQPVIGNGAMAAATLQSQREGR